MRCTLLRMSTATRRRVVLYGRLSAIKKGKTATRAGAVDKAQSVDDQLARLRAWAARENRDVVDELRDDGISASRFGKGKTRRGWQIAMDLISDGQTDELAIADIERSTRDRTMWAALAGACVDAGVVLLIDGRVHDPADPDDGFFLDMNVAAAVRAVAKISKDAKRAAEGRASRGAPHGRVLDGFKIEYDPDTGKALRRVVDPERAAIIREIAERLLAGESAYGIATDLNDRGLRTSTGKAWTGSNIVNRMRAPGLAGKRVHRGKVIDLDPEIAEKVPAILTLTEHRRLLALFADPSRKNNHEGPAVKYLGSGIYICGVCRSRVRMIVARRPDGGRRVRYTCSARSACVHRATEPTDLKVESAIVAFLSRPDVLAELRDADQDAEAAAAEARIGELRGELDEARQMHRARTLSLASLAHIESWALPEIERLERLARPRHVPSVVFDVAGPEAAERWAATPIGGKRAILKALVTVTIMPTARANQHTPFNADAIVVERRQR